MIEKMEDLGLDKLDSKAENALELLENILFEKLGVKFETLSQPIVDYVKNHAEELTLQFPNIAPRGDYSNLLEDNDSMAEFLKSLSFEDFKIAALTEDKKTNLIKFSFICSAVDDGDSLEGYTYLSKAGKIKHSFAQYCG